MLSAESANFTLKNSPHLVRAGEFDRSVFIILAQIDQANLRASRSDSPGRAVVFRFWKIGRVMTNKVTIQPKCYPPRGEGSERVRALVKELYPNLFSDGLDLTPTSNIFENTWLLDRSKATLINCTIKAYF